MPVFPKYKRRYSTTKRRARTRRERIVRVELTNRGGCVCVQQDGTGFWNCLTVQRIELPGGVAVHANFLREVEGRNARMRENAEESWEYMSKRRRAANAARALSASF